MSQTRTKAAQDFSAASAALRKRMQGKSCFNFKEVDPALFKELAALTQASYERLEKEGYLK